MMDDLVAQRLAIRPAGGVENAPPTLSFDRPRLIRLPWADFAALTRTDAQQSLESAADALKAYFERSWDHDSDRARTQGEIDIILGAGRIAAQSAQEDGAGRFVPLQPGADAADASAFPDGKGVFVQHGSGRWYRLIAVADITVEAFGTKNLYKAAWASVIGIELVRDTATGAVASTPTDTERVDLRASFIEARYKELVLHRNIAAASLAAARTNFDTAAKDLRATEAHKQDYLDNAREVERFEQSLRLLARQASEMGYTLFVEPLPEYKLVDDGKGNKTLQPVPSTGPKIKLRPVDESGTVGAEVEQAARLGRLYRRTVEKRTYTPTQTVLSIVGWLFPRLRRRVIKLPPVTQVVDVHVEVDTLRQPHLERMAELRDRGFDVHVCTLTDNGYETENGTPLELIMQQCEADEATRVGTVVFVPGYDFRLTGERVLTGYTVIHRPVAGCSPVAFPELSVRESLEYRTTWLHTEVGELVKAINLAPGERREITVTRSFQQETTQTRTASSVFDLASAESSDLATELERTARLETDLVDKMSASASVNYSATASGSYSMGPASASASTSVNASASASASRDKSVKNVGTDMAKSAQKAARSINQSRREEVSTSSASRTTVSTSDTSKSLIENINQGRTLNLLFYRLYNRYVGELYLTDLRLTVRSGTELIAGSGIFPVRTYSVGELGDVVAALEETPLPVKANEREGWVLRLAILREIGQLIEGEYAKLTAPPPASVTANPKGLFAGATARPDRSGEGSEADKPQDIVRFGAGLSVVMQVLHAMEILDTSASARTASRDGKTDREAEFNENLAKLIKELAPMEVRGLPINRTDILVAAEGLFMDAQVGAHPSTEPYFERMRDAEIAMRHAEIERVRSESIRNGALAQYMGAQSLSGGSNAVVHAGLADNALEIELLAPLGTGNWQLEQDGRWVEGALVNPGGRIVTHVFSGEIPAWASAGDFTRLALVEAATGKRLRFGRLLFAQGQP